MILTLIEIWWVQKDCCVVSLEGMENDADAAVKRADNPVLTCQRLF